MHFRIGSLHKWIVLNLFLAMHVQKRILRLALQICVFEGGTKSLMLFHVGCFCYQLQDTMFAPFLMVMLLNTHLTCAFHSYDRVVAL